MRKLWCLINYFTLISAAVLNPENTAKVEVFIQDLMKCRDIPGLTVAVVQGDETWTHGFGIEDKERNKRVTVDTLFGIGSVTKGFTTTLLAMLLNDTNGRLSWTSKVSEILGSDFAFVDEERTRELTLRDLLTHRTGLMTADLMLYSGFNHTFTRAELARRFRFLPEVKPLRDTWEYNNWVYALVGYIVEVLSGESYEETLDKRILQPLGMNKTRILGNTVTTDADGVAKPYFLIDDKIVLTNPSIYNIYPAEAAGAIASTAEDMAKWMHFLLKEGRTPNNHSMVSSRLLKEAFETHESLPKSFEDLSITRPTYPVSDVHYGYGYAWFTSTYKGYWKHWHSGGLHAYITYLELYPDLDCGIFISTNGPGDNSAAGTGASLIEYYILDLLLGEESWLNTSTACTYPLPWHQPSASSQNNSDVANVPVECVPCFVGRYGHQLYGDLEVKVGTGSGSLMLQYGRLKGTLNSTDNAAKFLFEAEEPFKLFSSPVNDTVLIPVTFYLTEGGKYQSVNLTYPYNMTFSRKISFSDPVRTLGESNGSFKLNSANPVSVYYISFLYLTWYI